VSVVTLVAMDVLFDYPVAHVLSSVDQRSWWNIYRDDVDLRFKVGLGSSMLLEVE